MPWVNPSLEPIVGKAKGLIFKEFKDISLTATVNVTSLEELIYFCVSELQKDRTDELEMKKQRFELQFMYGKYIKNKNEIWVVEIIGEVLDILIHEFLHSIQLCKPNRESTIDFLTFKITKNKEWIDGYILENWTEIEKNVGYQEIKNKILSKGDCEDF